MCIQVFDVLCYVFVCSSGQVIGRVQGNVKTQLIAHDKEVNDIILCNVFMPEGVESLGLN